MGIREYIVIIEYKDTLMYRNKSISIVFKDIFTAIDFISLQYGYFDYYIHDIKLLKINII